MSSRCTVLKLDVALSTVAHECKNEMCISRAVCIFSALSCTALSLSCFVHCCARSVGTAESRRVKSRSFICLLGFLKLVSSRPSNMLAYLRDGSAQSLIASCIPPCPQTDRQTSLAEVLSLTTGTTLEKFHKKVMINYCIQQKVGEKEA